MVNKLSPTLFARRCERLPSRHPAAMDWRRVGCLVWPGSVPTVRIAGRDYAPPRASWAVHCGPIPSGMLVMARCGDSRCCEPEHLLLGYRDRVRRRPPVRTAVLVVVLDARRLAKRI